VGSTVLSHMLGLTSENSGVVDPTCLHQQLIELVVIHFSLLAGSSQDENLFESVGRRVGIGFFVEHVEIHFLFALELHLPSGALQLLLLQKTARNLLQEKGSCHELGSLRQLECHCFAH